MLSSAYMQIFGYSPLKYHAFKVMGTTKIAGAQGVLEARDRLHQNEDVPLQIIP